jgi:hypothetical protein
MKDMKGTKDMKKGKRQSTTDRADANGSERIVSAHKQSGEALDWA